jgi:hypothetical protein
MSMATAVYFSLPSRRGSGILFFITVAAGCGSGSF